MSVPRFYTGKLGFFEKDVDPAGSYRRNYHKEVGAQTALILQTFLQIIFIVAPTEAITP